MRVYEHSPPQPVNVQVQQHLRLEALFVEGNFSLSWRT